MTTTRDERSDIPTAAQAPAIIDGTPLPPVDEARRQPVAFRSDGWTLAGHWYPGSDRTPRAATLVMAGPMTSVKEETLPHYAVAFADAGYHVLTFDNRKFGASEGQPRAQLDTGEQVRDLKNALSYVRTRADVDPDHVGLATVCLGAGYGLEVAAFDRRVKAVALIGGGYDLTDTYWAMLGPAGFADYLTNLTDARDAAYATNDVPYLPAIAPGPEYGPSAMPIREAYEYYRRAHDVEAPNWENRLTVDSMESLLAWNVVDHAAQVTQPAIVVHGTNDVLLPPEYAQAVFDRLAGHKGLAWVETHNHVEIYDQNPYVAQAIDAVLEFFATHLPATRNDR